jgi:hypothetical protein
MTEPPEVQYVVKPGGQPTAVVVPFALWQTLRAAASQASQFGLSQGEPEAAELAHLAMLGGAVNWLADEPDLYSDADLQERFPWAA